MCSHKLLMSNGFIRQIDAPALVASIKTLCDETNDAIINEGAM